MMTDSAVDRHPTAGNGDGEGGILARPLFHLLLIALLGVLVYSNTFQVPFDLDDRTSIVENRVIKDLSLFFSGAGYGYNPRRFIGYLTMALNYRLGGLDVTGYHIFNLAVHIISACLVYALVQLTLRTPFFAMRSAECGVRSGEDRSLFIPHSAFRIPHSLVPLLAALLFVAHPVQTQAVTYVVQRFASLATMFYLASLVFYVRARLCQEEERLAGSKAAACYLFALVSAGLAMRTKEIAFTLPFIVVLYEFSFFKATARKRLLMLLPVLLTVLIVPVSMLNAGRPLGELLSDMSEMARQTRVISRGDYLLTQFSVIATYLRLLVLPVNQNLDYDYPVYHSLFAPRVLLSFTFLLALLVVAVWLYYRSSQFKMQNANCKLQNEGDKNNFAICNLQFAICICTPAAWRLAAFGILWFFITLSVESSVIPIADVIFEHRLYLPSVGFFIALVAALFWGVGRVGTVLPAVPRLAVPLMGVVVLILAGAAHARNHVWGDGVRLWEDVVRKSPSKARCHSALGVHYASRGRADEAIREFLTAIRLDATDVKAHGNLGALYAQKGLFEPATWEFKIALILDSAYAEAHSGLGIILASQGKLDEAVEEFRAALALKPDNADASNNLGIIYARQGRLDEAIARFTAALRTMPDDSESHYNLGMAFAQQGRLDEAAREFKAAIRLEPGYARAIDALEMIAVQQRGR